MGHPDLPIKKTLVSLFCQLTAMILKRVSESILFYILFQSNKSTACKVKDEKELANFLMAFSLRKITIHFKVRSIYGSSET